MTKRMVLAAVLAMGFFTAGVGRAQGRDPHPDEPIDAALRSQVIEAVVRNMKDYYVFPEVAGEVEKALRGRRGEYERFTSAAELAKALTIQLREVSRDKHVSVNYSHKPLPVRREQAAPTAEERQGLRNYGEDINYGFERVERRAGNDGGQPDMIVLLASYLFGDEPVQPSGLYRRKTNTIQQYWTMPYVPAKGTSPKKSTS